MQNILTLFTLLVLCISYTLAADIDDYVAKFDENYQWTYLGAEQNIHGRNVRGDASWTGYLLNVTSQKWLEDSDFSPDSQMKSIWWHIMVVIVPDEVKYTSNATMWITGWSNSASLPAANDEDVVLSASLAMGTGTITGALFQIPCEKIIFATDPIQKSRGEDAIIAFTWDHYLKDPSNPEWLVRFPMVKASMRAMDAMTEFVAKELPELNANLDSFVVAGASKRGWTTWLVGVVDPIRVKGIVPIVLDAINFAAVEHHQWKSYGGWTWALQDYIDMDIMSRLDDPNMLLLQQQVDPYFFFDRMTMPKLVVNAVLDEFQQPDDTHFWWNDMPEPKHFLMTPNAEHSEATGIFEIVPAIGTWIAFLLKEHAIPEFTWEISETTGEIVATLNDVGDVYEASMWYAYSCGTNFDGIHSVKRRDFRIMNVDEPCECGIPAEGYCANLKSGWTREILDVEMVNGKRTYKAHMDAPTDGRYVSFMIDIKYVEVEGITNKFGNLIEKFTKVGNNHLPVDKPGRLEFTTEVSILPNTFPFEDCTGQGCTGHIV